MDVVSSDVDTMPRKLSPSLLDSRDLDNDDDNAALAQEIEPKITTTRTSECDQSHSKSRSGHDDR